ncbi:MAG: response regulator transcription factor [Erysipelotrichia bacterium]|nr:response regulator transcription factor [Erysipelotrichia bacterium]NCC55159.1 response regulator transcription factor [Erysipelotrichia bacterium]
MLRIAIIEKDAFAKDLIFTLSKVLDNEFSFVHYEKISEFIKRNDANAFDVIILNEAYNNIRVTSALNYQKSNAIVIYCSQEKGVKEYSYYTRIFTIDVENYVEELKRIKPFLQERLISHKEYFFNYNGIKVRLKYHDIYYIEKEDKNLVYHTKMGNFVERGSIAKKSEELLQYDFIRIHSGVIVNYEYIFKVDDDQVELINHEILPVSRARKATLTEFIRSKSKL